MAGNTHSILEGVEAVVAMSIAHFAAYQVGTGPLRSRGGIKINLPKFLGRHSLK